VGGDVAKWAVVALIIGYFVGYMVVNRRRQVER
jgi:ABC-type cobalt transport system substrate-binding protein